VSFPAVETCKLGWFSLANSSLKVERSSFYNIIFLLLSLWNDENLLRKLPGDNEGRVKTRLFDFSLRGLLI